MVGPNPLYTPDPIPPANTRRRVIGATLNLAHSQEAELHARLVAARLQAIALRSALNDAKTVATAGSLGTPTAGDDMITAITTLVTAMDAALVSLRDVSDLSYDSYAEAA